MRLSESLRKNLFEASAGGILNKLRIRKRRSTFFFEEIGSEYIRRCEQSGHEKEMMNVGQEWMDTSLNQLMPGGLRRIPPLLLVNIIKKIWITSGLMDDFRISKKGNVVNIKTTNEGLTRLIGENNLMKGMYMGVLKNLFSRQVELIKSAQTMDKCEYVFRLGDKVTASIVTRSRNEYNKANRLEYCEGLTIKDLLQNNTLRLRENNNVYFRGKMISPIESTLFHLLGNRGILMDIVSDISYNYFKDIIKESSEDKKLSLLKVLLQAMGWGMINIIIKGDGVVFDIKNPPCGTQIEDDNWDFLIKTILGYLWLIDKRFSVSKIDSQHRHLMVRFSSKD